MKVLLPLAVIAICVAGWYGGPLVYSTSASTSASQPPRGSITTDIGPIALTSQHLKAEAMALKQPMFWAGPTREGLYEFSRTRSDHVFVRYLPRGVRAGAPGAHFLVVATYPFPTAYKALKKAARGRGVAGPGGSVIFARPNDPRSVLLAYPRFPYEIEVFDPNPARARALAQSGLVRPVG
jgi:hypothetical protein